MSEWKVREPRPDEEAGWLGKATIAEVIVKKGHEIFGEGAQNAESDFLQIQVDRNGKPAKVGQIRLFPDMKILHPKSTAAKFVKTYGGAPKKGMKINVKTNSDGFWELVL